MHQMGLLVYHLNNRDFRNNEKILLISFLPMQYARAFCNAPTWVKSDTITAIPSSKFENSITHRERTIFIAIIKI